MASFRLAFTFFMTWTARLDSAGDAEDLAAVPAEFQRLFEMVAQGKAARNWDVGDHTVKQVCQYGISNTTVDIARFLLGAVSPPIQHLEINYKDVEGADDSEASQYLSQLQAEFGARVERGSQRLEPLLVQAPHVPQAAASLSKCDLVLFSDTAPWFTIERMLPHLAEDVVIAFVSFNCAYEEGDKASPNCHFINTMWEKTALMRRGYCLRSVCMSRVPSEILHDPNLLALDCDKFSSLDADQNTSAAEFGQDWYLYYNFLQHSVVGRRGVYVDVGASLPFDYSNTVVLDRCMSWEGVCVEPNPHLVPFISAYRNCQVFNVCVDDAAAASKHFSDRDGVLAFSADCLPLADILDRAGFRNRRIDVLSVDVEHGELAVFKNFPLTEFDIRFIVIEVTHGARWLEVDTLILPHGYAKVAVLGRDVVYAKLEELASRGFAQQWPLLQEPEAVLPPGWSDFHHRVVNDELEEEMRRERTAFYAGLRRGVR